MNYELGLVIYRELKYRTFYWLKALPVGYRNIPVGYRGLGNYKF